MGVRLEPCRSSMDWHRYSDWLWDHQSSSADREDTTMERRAFVKSGALALVTMGLSPSFLRRTAFGMELMNAPKGKVLICLFQRGAADGLNVIVPHGEKAYYAMRPSIAIPQPSSSAR